MTETTIKFIKEELGERAYDELLMAQESFELARKHITDDQDKVQVELSTAAFSLRKILERFIGYICELLGGKYDAEESDLHETIQTLYKKKDISEEVYNLANQIRKTGNKGAHGSDLSLEECDNAFKDLDNMIKTYVTTDRKYKKRKKHTLVKVVVCLVILAVLIIGCIVLMTFIE